MTDEKKPADEMPEEEVKDSAAEQEPEAPETDKAEAAAEQAAPASEENEELQSKYLRLAADFQNYKRRAVKEKEDVYRFANEGIVGDLLSVIDNFDRALETGRNSEDKAMLEGMELIFKQFADILKKHGLEEVEALGKPFDPNFHHAVMMETTDEYESGQVSAVLQKGYMLNTKVIRPAMVKVAE